MGAIASGGTVDLDESIVQHLGVTRAQVEHVLRREAVELERRERVYRNGRTMTTVRGKTVIVVDDGLATGATMRAAVSALRRLEPARIVAATPVASNEACEVLRRLADECVCVSTPEPFHAVGIWYRDFTPTSDAEVMAWLDLLGEGSKRNAKNASEGAAS
jgi:predicted phosphoribosyltransferase